VRELAGSPLQRRACNQNLANWAVDSWRWSLLSVGSGSLAVASIGLVFLLLGA
jgi:hypothetical protein